MEVRKVNLSGRIDMFMVCFEIHVRGGKSDKTGRWLVGVSRRKENIHEELIGVSFEVHGDGSLQGKNGDAVEWAGVRREVSSDTGAEERRRVAVHSRRVTVNSTETGEDTSHARIVHHSSTSITVIAAEGLEPRPLNTNKR